MNHRAGLGAVLLAVLLLYAPWSRAQAEGEILARTVLGIYDSATEQSARWSRVHRFAELPLNYLGLRVRYWDIQQGWPDSQALSGVRGIVLWPRGYRLRDPEGLWRGVEQALERGIGVALLGGPFEIADARGNPPPLAASSRALRLLGFAYTGLYEDVSLGWRVSHADAPRVEFERRLDGPLPGFGIYVMAGDGMRSHLAVANTQREEWPTSHLVMSRPGAVFADSAFVLWQGHAKGQVFTQWRIDPFFFFRRAFQTDALPKLDPTTASNRRVLFALVDGDGWSERSNLFQYREQGAMAAEVLYREVLTRFPQLPFSVAPIGMDLDPQRPGTERARRVATAVFALPHVAPALHSYSHPLRWHGQSHPGTPAESAEPVIASSPSWSRWLGAWLPASWRASRSALVTDTPAQAAVPHIDLGLEFDTARAVVEAVLPSTKTIPLMHWPGDAMPSPEALREATQRGWLTLGGGPVAPRSQFSYSTVAPFGFVEGNGLQVYLGNENETETLAGWPSAEALRRRLAATDSPRRVSPLGLYFQAACASDTRRLNTLRAALDTVLREPAIATWPHVYASAVAGFQSAQIAAVGKNTWRIRQRGALNSVRLDGVTGWQVDFTRSTGIIAEHRVQDALHVAFDPEASEVLLALREASAATQGTKLPVLHHANWHLRGLHRRGDTVGFVAAGFGEGDIQLSAAPHSTFAVRVFRGTERLWQQETATDAAGQLRLTLPALAMTPVAVELQLITRRARETNP